MPNAVIWVKRFQPELMSEIYSLAFVCKQAAVNVLVVSIK